MVDAPWTLGNLTIPASILAQAEGFAVAAYERDEEGCGYLSGPASDPLAISAITALENLANKYHRLDPESHPRTGREYFKINSLKFERALAEGEASGQPVKVFFHSHLDCGAYFSEEDAASMTMGGTGEPPHALCYLVTAVDAAQVTAHRLFRWDGDLRAFVECPFTVVEG